MAGLSAYKYNLNTSSGERYWTGCPSITEKAVAGTTDEHYSVITMHSEGHTQAQCEEHKEAAIIETSGSADGTFRIESTGTAGTGSEKATRKLVATFSHPGFLNYVYLTNYEILDPAAQANDPSDCEYYYSERKAKNLLGNPPSGCGNIEFASEDKINGPMHTNDAAEVCATNGSKPTFGREGHHDKIEMNGGHYAASGCKNEINLLGEFTEKGPTLTPPETDTELLETADDKWAGRTEIELKATNPNTLQRTNNKGEKLAVEDFPANGVIYVENEGACSVKYSPYGTDVNYETDQTCGNVYVHGEYTEALTIAAQNDIIINGNLKTKTEGTEGKPIGEGRLGLIATNFVRVYHKVKKGYNPSQIYPVSFVPTAATGKCVTKVEASAKVLRSTEVSEIPTTGLENGAEVEGTVAGEIEHGTTISKVEPGNKIILSKAAKPAAKELSANVLRSTEVTGITTTGLEAGDEVEGTIAGEIESKTTIAKVEPGNKIILSKAAKPAAKELAGSTHSSTEITNITPTGLVAGDEVEGSGIAARTTISSIKELEKKIVLSKPATKTESGIKLKFFGESTKLKFYGEKTTLKFYVTMANYKYDSLKGECYKEESGYNFEESEERYVVACESGSTYTDNDFCEYENNSSGCSSKAENVGEPVSTIDAAILSTAHSFIVDNFECGKHLGELTVWGAIAQFWRGTVGEGEHGYVKNYNYDERLEYLQPPDFLSPTSSQLKLDRITAASS